MGAKLKTLTTIDHQRLQRETNLFHSQHGAFKSARYKPISVDLYDTRNVSERISIGKRI